MAEISEAARQARNAHRREYYRQNRERVLAQNKRWRDRNPEKVAACNVRYWERRAAAAAESEVTGDGR